MLQPTIERDVNPAEALALAGRSMDEYNKDFRYFAKHVEELTKQYPDEWVAVFDCKVVAHDRQRKQVERQLRLSGLSRRSPIVQFLETRPITLIL